MAAEFPGVDGDFEAGFLSHEESFPEVFGFVVIFPVVNTDADCLGRTIGNHFPNQLNGSFRCIFAVNGRDEASDDTEVTFAFMNALNDGSLCVGITVVAGKTRIVPEELGVANAVFFAVSQIFVGNALEH